MISSTQLSQLNFCFKKLQNFTLIQYMIEINFKQKLKILTQESHQLNFFIKIS
jgi:hypothetical protein